MTEQKLTIAVIGAGGKMGMRVSNNLQRSEHTVFYSENSPAGQQRTVDAGREVTPTERGRRRRRRHPGRPRRRSRHRSPPTSCRSCAPAPSC